MNQPDTPSVWRRTLPLPVWALAAATLTVCGIGTAIGAGGNQPAQSASAPAERVTVRATETVTAQPDPTPTEPDTAQHDQSRLACEHFRHIMGDVADGVLTDDELRTKLREVDSNAAIATPQVQQAARSLIAAATTGTVDEFEAAMAAMHEGCLAAGW